MNIVDACFCCLHRSGRGRAWHCWGGQLAGAAVPLPPGAGTARDPASLRLRRLRRGGASGAARGPARPSPSPPPPTPPPCPIRRRPGPGRADLAFVVAASADAASPGAARPRGDSSAARAGSLTAAMRPCWARPVASSGCGAGLRPLCCWGGAKRPGCQGRLGDLQHLPVPQLPIATKEIALFKLVSFQ